MLEALLSVRDAAFQTHCYKRTSVHPCRQMRPEPRIQPREGARVYEGAEVCGGGSTWEKREDHWRGEPASWEGGSAGRLGPARQLVVTGDSLARGDVASPMGIMGEELSRATRAARTSLSSTEVMIRMMSDELGDQASGEMGPSASAGVGTWLAPRWLTPGVEAAKTPSSSTSSASAELTEDTASAELTEDTALAFRSAKDAASAWSTAVSTGWAHAAAASQDASDLSRARLSMPPLARTSESVSSACVPPAIACGTSAFGSPMVGTPETMLRVEAEVLGLPGSTSSLRATAAKVITPIESPVAATTAIVSGVASSTCKRTRAKHTALGAAGSRAGEFPHLDGRGAGAASQPIEPGPRKALSMHRSAQ